VHESGCTLNPNLGLVRSSVSPTSFRESEFRRSGLALQRGLRDQ
jgi:hypothetical protein